MNPLYQIVPRCLLDSEYFAEPQRVVFQETRKWDVLSVGWRLLDMQAKMSDRHAPLEREQTCSRAGARASLLSLSFRSQPPCLPLTLAGIPSLGASVSKSVK